MLRTQSRKILLAHESFKFVTELKSGSKKFFMQGHISTKNSDKFNDIVTDEAQDDMVKQIKSSRITLDLDHESFKDKKGGIAERPYNKIPVGKIVETSRTSEGTFVKADFNEDHPMYDRILNSVKNGFLHSFSIAYLPEKFITKVIDGVKHRVISKLKLLNVGITGIPVNPEATFEIVTKSFLTKMEEEQKKEHLEEESSQEKEDNEEVHSEVKSLSERIQSLSNTLKGVEAELQSICSKQNISLKSSSNEVDTLRLCIDDVKSELESLRKPVLKGIVEPQYKDVELEQKKSDSILNYIV